ncbi:MAG: biopolymer transporter ExbD [Planctomycetota bacterium]|nr:MAG: biopolymer transporter ExbD [Planctomycetota bacterium]
MLLKADSSTDASPLDLTPMIDMMFLLLIFFLVATTFQQTEREMKIALPFAEAAGPISATLREIIVNVDAEGRIILAGRRVEPEDFRRTIQEAVAAHPEQKVSVRGDRSTDYGNVVRVLDICKAAGIQEPYLDTVLEGR